MIDLVMERMMMRANIDVMHNPCMDTKEIGGMGDDELCAVGLSEWAYVHTGSENLRTM